MTSSCDSSMRRWPLVLSLLLMGACGSSEPGSTPSDSASPDAGPPNQVPAADAAPVTPTAPPGTVVVTVKATETRVVQGASAKLAIEVARGPDLASSPVEVRLSGLPAGVAADTLVIPPGTSQGELTVAASAASTQGRTQVTVEAKATAGAITASPVKTVLFVRGAPGALDTTFGDKGVASITPAAGITGLSASSVLLTDDGKTIIVGVRASPRERRRFSSRASVRSGGKPTGSSNLSSSSEIIGETDEVSDVCMVHGIALEDDRAARFARFARLGAELAGRWRLADTMGSQATYVPCAYREGAGAGRVNRRLSGPRCFAGRAR